MLYSSIYSIIIVSSREFYRRSKDKTGNIANFFAVVAKSQFISVLYLGTERSIELPVIKRLTGEEPREQVVTVADFKRKPQRAEQLRLLGTRSGVIHTAEEATRWISPVWFGLVWSGSAWDDARPLDATSTEASCIIGLATRIDTRRNWVKTAPSGTVLDYLAHVTGACVSEASPLHHVFPASGGAASRSILVNYFSSATTDRRRGDALARGLALASSKRWREDSITRYDTAD